MTRFSLSESTVRDVAAEFGATVTEIGTTGSGHRFAMIALAGHSRKVIFPSTPSDWRAHKNLATELRKILRGM